MGRTGRSVAGRVVAVTGGGRGIGAATARALAAAGARVAVGDLDAALAERTAAALGGDAAGLPLDVTDPAAFAGFLDAAEDALGPLDVLVNNAGVMITGDFAAEPPALFERMVDVNLRGVVTGTRLAVARFLPRDRGHVVNVASMAGVSAFPGVATYTATKHAVVGFGKALRAEYRGSGLRFSTILPGLVNTELSAGADLSRPVRRFAGAEPEEVAAAVVRAVTGERAVTYVPGRLGALLHLAPVLPERTVNALVAALGARDAFRLADETARAAYHRRVTEQTTR